MNKQPNNLILHCHTSGINYNGDVTDGYQIISVAGIVLSPLNKKLSQIEKYIVFDVKNKWDNKARSIHGFSQDKLKSVGESENVVYEDFALFLADHFNIIEDKIQCIGYNIDTFTLPFIKVFLKDIPIKFSYSNIDLKSLFCLEQNKIVDIKKFISFFSSTHSKQEQPSSIEMCNIFHMAYRYYCSIFSENQDGN